MIRPEVQYNLERLSSHLQLYGQLSKKTEEVVIVKQSAELAWNVYRGLLALKPAKGSIRAERIAALKAGGGIHIRDSVKIAIAGKYNATTSLASGKTYLKQGRSMRTELTSADGDYSLNLSALLVEREIAIRERGRGFAAAATPRPPASWKSAREIQGAFAQFERESNYGFRMSDFTMVNGAERKYATLRWLGRQGTYESPVEGLSKEKQQKVLAAAILATDENMAKYINEHIAADIAKAGLN